MKKQERIDEFIKDPKKSFFKISLPILVGMLVQTLYNVVDTAFVGRLGAEAIAALTFSFPIFFLLMSINAGIGVGTSSKVSRLLGQKKKQEAGNVALHGLLMTGIFSIILFVVGLLFIKPLFSLLGADEAVMPLAISYMSIIFWGVFFMLPTYVMNSVFAAQGDSKISMKIQVISLILNMILDPILIYSFKLGVRGAALATFSSFVVGFILTIYFNKKSHLKIKLKQFIWKPKYIKEIITIGLPASLTMFTMSIYFMFINKLLSYFGTEYVAAGGIVSRLESVATMPIIAFATGLMTLVGMFFGAKRYDLLRGIIRHAIKTGLLVIVAVTTILFIFPHLFLSIFTNDQSILNLAVPYMRVELFTFPFLVVVIMVNRTMQGMGYGLPSLMISLIRVIVISIPLACIFIFVLHLNYLYIAVSMILGTFVASIVAFFWLKKKLFLLNS